VRNELSRLTDICNEDAGKTRGVLSVSLRSGEPKALVVCDGLKIGGTILDLTFSDGCRNDVDSEISLGREFSMLSG
jgi:hypothetical protein